MGNEIVELGTSPIVTEVQGKREAVKVANATPFPGSLKKAFSIVPSIEVGPFKVRPFYDGDFDILITIGNPLGDLMAKKMANNDVALDNYFPRGQTVWEICYLFTTPIRQAWKEVEDGQFKHNARDKFMETQLLELVEIHNAVMQQLGVYWSTAIGFEAVEDTAEGEAKKKQ